MKLRFHPRAGALVPDPRFPRATGQPVRRIGFSVDGKLEERPAEFDEADPGVRRLVKLVVRDGALLPADKETAAFCGVRFVDVERKGDGYEPKRPAAKSQKGGE